MSFDEPIQVSVVDDECCREFKTGFVRLELWIRHTCVSQVDFEALSLNEGGSCLNFALGCEKLTGWAGQPDLASGLAASER